MSIAIKHGYFKILRGGGGTFMKHIKMFRAALAALVTVLLTSQLQATDIFVSPTGSGDFSGSSWSNAINGNEENLLGIKVRTVITDAVAADAEEVNVYFASGEYVTTNQITLSSIAIPVKLSGGYIGETDGSFDRSETATTLKRSTYNIRFISATSLSSFVVEGITFSGGYVQATGAKGGAILLTSANAKIQNCYFNNNGFSSTYKDSRKSGVTYLGGGGAIAAITSGDIEIKDCLFEGNYHKAGGSYNQSAGGALLAYNVTLKITDCEFLNNYMSGGSGRNTLFGAAIATYYGTIEITGSTFTGNYILGATATPSGASGGALAIRAPKNYFLSDSVFEKNYVAADGDTTFPFNAGIMLIDDFNGSTVSTSVVERCVFDSRNAPSTASSRTAQSDVLLAGGQLFMTNCVVLKAKGNSKYGNYSIRNLGTLAYSGNTTKYYGYVYSDVSCTKSNMELVNCTIADGKAYGVAAMDAGAELHLKNCIVSGHSLTGVVNATSIEHSYIQTHNDGSWDYAGAGNLNPNVVGDINWTGAPYYHLLTKNANGAITNGWFSGTFESAKTAADSPCIDAGAPGSLGLDLEPYYSGRRVNIGAYGGTPWASKTSPLPGFKLIIR